MKYENNEEKGCNFLSAERAWLTPPEPDERISRLLREREQCLEKAAWIESELWDEYGLVPD